MVRYSYDECIEDTRKIIKDLNKEYDAIIAISRGGLTFAHLLASGLDLRTVHAINVASYDATIQRESVAIDTLPDLSQCRNVLIAEDIVDSGKSMHAVTQMLEEKYPTLHFDVAALFFKQTAIYTPKYFARHATEWIQFCWEINEIL
ncbi:MAG: phosphoribosyltransferase family protein [Thiovulaceae bacterium]|nr:phosphoribosyltransferase family protein [Sulfurimonadaceae bacterium]